MKTRFLRCFLIFSALITLSCGKTESANKELVNQSTAVPNGASIQFVKMLQTNSDQINKVRCSKEEPTHEQNFYRIGQDSYGSKFDSLSIDETGILLKNSKENEVTFINMSQIKKILLFRTKETGYSLEIDF